MNSLASILSTTTNLRHADTVKWTNGNWPLCIGVSLSYLLLVFAGPRFMRDRPPMNLRRPLVLWNAALALFSIMGSYVLVPELIERVKTGGLVRSYCRIDGYFDGASGFWAFLFLLSKIAELGDTAFLIARKRPVIFLHWFHHVSVLLWMWVAYPSGCAGMRWGIDMNYVVHGVMYSYFTLRALEVKIPRWVATCITSLQMVQFAVAIAVTTDILRHPDSENPLVTIVGQLSLYTLYLALFAQFFITSYCRPKSKTA